MTRKIKTKLTPELLIEAPRPTPAVPNENGTSAVYTVSTYNLESHTEFKVTKLIDLETGKASPYSDDQKNKSFQWLTDELLMWQREGDEGKTELWIQSRDKSDDNPLHIGSIEAAIENVKTKKLPGGDIAIVFTAPADKDQNLFNAAKATKPSTSAREWQNERPRFWDTYVDKHRSVLWYTTLQQVTDKSKYRLSNVGPINALRDTGLVLPTYNDPLGSADFDISPKGIIFSTNDSELNKWRDWQNALYYIPLTTFQEEDVPPVQKIKVPGQNGTHSSPKFANDVPLAAFIAVKEKDAWSRRTLFVMRTDSPKVLTQIKLVDDHDDKSDWDLYAESLVWSKDNKTLYVTANDHAVTKVFSLALGPMKSDTQHVVPSALSVTGSVTSVHTIGKEGQLVINSSSFIDSNTISVVIPDSGDDSALFNTKVIFSQSKAGSAYGLSSSQVSSIHYPGGPDGKTSVQCWILTPSSYNPKSSKKYPLFIFMHGGPQVAVLDQWSTRWNPLVFAEQEYIVAIPNFTGSDSFGRDFVTAINGQLGGYPYLDFERCFSWLEKNMPKCDTTRAVAAGGSYGGYMANWVAGQPLAKKLRTIICHDGILDNFTQFMGDDAAFTSSLRELFGTVPFDSSLSDEDAVTKAKEEWRRWSPIEFIHNWSTSMLFIHSDKDFRCQITDAWAAYNICQMKGIKARILNFPDENHWVLGRENNYVWQRTVMGWCNEEIGRKGEEGAIQLEWPKSEAEWVGKSKKDRIVVALA